MNSEIRRISVDFIEQEFRNFKISRNFLSENLISSVKKYGVINPVYLLEKSGAYIPVLGHNRIECARLSGLKTVPSIVDSSIDINYYFNQSIIKVYNDGAGPTGKIKLLKILSDEFKFSLDSVESLCIDFSIPAGFIKKEKIEKFMSLPAGLLDYIDFRDVQYKIIEKILKLDKYILEFLELWSEKTTMKLNLFKSAVDMLFDLQKKGISPDDLNKISPDDYDDRNAAENIIHERLFSLRYPGYNEMLKKSDKIRNSLAGNKIIAEIPKYFESGLFYIKIPVDTKSGYMGFKNRIDSIKQGDIEEILKLL